MKSMKNEFMFESVEVLLNYHSWGTYFSMDLYWDLRASVGIKLVNWLYDKETIKGQVRDEKYEI